MRLKSAQKEVFEILKSLNILYVEDEVTIREEMELNIKDFFNNFLMAEDGVDGVKKFQESDVDIVITDIQMPKMNGLDMIEEIRKISSDIPIIITTAFTEVNYLKRSIDLNVDGYLAKPIKIMNLIDTIYKSSAKIVNKRLQRELKDINQNLENMVKEKIEELREKDKLILKQSRYAAMGEMIDAIAHQWKQPLNTMSLISMGIEYKCETGDFNREYCENVSEDLNQQIAHLNQTLNEFRSFFKENKKRVLFDIKKIVESVLLLTKDEYIKDKIKVSVTKKSISINGYPNELKHVILNIINNARDAFIDKNISNRFVEITLSESESFATISIEDNAGGVKESDLPHIFESHFTTKGSKGSGVGLYLTKMIIEHMRGEISVENSKDGAIFRVKIPKLNS